LRFKKVAKQLFEKCFLPYNALDLVDVSDEAVKF